MSNRFRVIVLDPRQDFLRLRRGGDEEEGCDEESFHEGSLAQTRRERWRLAGWLGGVSPLGGYELKFGVLPERERDAPAPAGETPALPQCRLFITRSRYTFAFATAAGTSTVSTLRLRISTLPSQMVVMTELPEAA